MLTIHVKEQVLKVARIIEYGPLVELWPGGPLVPDIHKTIMANRFVKRDGWIEKSRHITHAIERVNELFLEGRDAKIVGY